MKTSHLYGLVDGELVHPRREPRKYRFAKLNCRRLRLCCVCGSRRCLESIVVRQRTWKVFRRTQYRPNR